MNNVVLMGRLTKDVDLRYTQSGTAMAFFTLAVDRGLSKEKRQQAESTGQPTADFISCKAWGKVAETIGNYVKKGQRLLVQGSIETGSYEKNGQKIFTTTVNVRNMEFIEKAGDTGQNNGFGPKDGQAGEYYAVDNSDVPFY